MAPKQNNNSKFLWTHFNLIHTIKIRFSFGGRDTSEITSRLSQRDFTDFYKASSGKIQTIIPVFLGMDLPYPCIATYIYWAMLKNGSSLKNILGPPAFQEAKI